MTLPAIDARGLVKTFRGGLIRALDGLDIVVAAGDMTAITGPSGGGKSTLLYAMAGLLPLDRGNVAVYGKVPGDRASWTKLRQREIGLVFQDDWLLPTLSAAENIELPMIGVVNDHAARQKRVASLLDQVNARDFADRMPVELSGGERQRIAVARGLANQPRILLADEPTGELDSVNAGIIVDLLHRLHRNENLTVAIVTHNDEVARSCGRQFHVRDGKGYYVERV